MNDYISEFEKALLEAGLGTPAKGIISDGAIHRFRGDGDKKSKKNSWYTFNEDGNTAWGSFGNWRTRLKQNWTSGSYQELTPEEKCAFAIKRQAEREAQQRKELEQHNLIADKAWSIYQQSTQADENHPYLIKKRVKAHSLRTYNNALLMPLIDCSGRLWSLQFIDAKSNKRFLRGGRKKGLFYLIGCKLKQLGGYISAFVCEGLATGHTIFESTAIPVFVALDVYNIRRVLSEIKKHFSFLKVVVAGDDDRDKEDNNGRKYAEQAAKEFQCGVIFPQFPESAPLELSDFNDLAVWRAEHG